MTGAVLGGGSDALHQLVLVFTNFFESAAGKLKGTEVRAGNNRPTAVQNALD